MSAMFGGSKPRAFKKGWAIPFGSFSVGHFYERIGVTDVVVASCGHRAYVAQLFGIGTFPACKKCQRKHGAPNDVRTCVDDVKGNLT
jgi:hypothetical protein